MRYRKWNKGYRKPCEDVSCGFLLRKAINPMDMSADIFGECCGDQISCMSAEKYLAREESSHNALQHYELSEKKVKKMKSKNKLKTVFSG